MPRCMPLKTRMKPRIESRTKPRFLLLGLTVATLAGCAPEVGSERWCEAMNEKPKGDWTANEALAYAEHCLID